MIEALVLGLKFPEYTLAQHPVALTVDEHDLLTPSQFVVFQRFAEHVHLKIQNILVFHSGSVVDQAVNV